MSFRARAYPDPLPGFRFAVGFADTALPAGAVATGGVTPTVAGFSEVSGLESSLQIEEYREGGRNELVHKLATRASFGNITLRRGVAIKPDLWEWYERVRRGSFGARRAIMIAHLDEVGNPVLAWYVARALPAKYTGASWNAQQSSAAIEAIEIAHEGLELVPGSEVGVV